MTAAGFCLGFLVIYIGSWFFSYVNLPKNQAESVSILRL